MYQDVSHPTDLTAHAIHVWRIDLNVDPERVAGLAELLSPDERARAERFFFPENRSHFVIARGTMRRLLGGYVQTAPEEVVFRYNDYGKPQLDTDIHGTDLRFNLSHSADIALLAVAAGRELGIDIEYVREVGEADQIAARQFDAVESASYAALPAHLRQEGFFVRWTLKEAFIKAHGSGLTLPLPSFSVASQPAPDGYHRVRTNDPSDEHRWRGLLLPALPGFVSALVAEGSDWQVACFRWRAS